MIYRADIWLTVRLMVMNWVYYYWLKLME